ncbi:MAG: hypothetical protein ACM3O6_08930 [Acidobacteriota bacterium]
MNRFSACLAALALAVGAATFSAGPCLAQMSSGGMGQGMPGQHPQRPMMRPQPGAAAVTPSMPGQDAFGAVQEIVRILEADPKTDWTKVNLALLREHLIDMNEVTLHADAQETPIGGGIEIAITGQGRVLAAIQRMIPDHAKEINGSNGWSVNTEPLPNGVLLTVTASDPKETAHIRGLGFIGLLVTGSHHQAHHLAMAKGEMTH